MEKTIEIYEYEIMKYKERQMEKERVEFCEYYIKRYEELKKEQRAAAVERVKNIVATWNVEPWEVFPYVPKRIRMGEPIKTAEEEPEK